MFNFDKGQTIRMKFLIFFLFLFLFIQLASAISWTRTIYYNVTVEQSNYSNYSNFSAFTDFWDNIDTPFDFSQARFSDNISIGNATTTINGTRITTDEIFCSNISANNICYSNGTNCVTGNATGNETDPSWRANYTNMLVDCPDGNYSYGIYNNGSFKCRNDRTILSSNLYASTITDYTQIFVIPLTPNKINIIQIYLVQNSSAIIRGVQNKANLSSANGPGTCKYITMSNLGEFVAPVILTTTTADSNALSSFLEPTLNTIECSILTNASSTNLIISFQPETAGTVQTFAGSYYTMVVY